MPSSTQVISEMLPEIHTMEKCDFLKSIIHSKIIYFSVFYSLFKFRKILLTI